MKAPIAWQWNGEAMIPFTRSFAKRADEQFIVGERYMLSVVEERSAAAHKAYFAALKDAWLNLPEPYPEQFPTAEHLRKFALIKCGYCETRQIVSRSAAEAVRLAAFIRPIDEYVLVLTRGPVVTVYTAQSQKYNAMDRQTFRESANAVLDYVAELIGTNREDLEANARNVS